jgi:molybdenum cofactor cytidylyltransferase
MTDRSVTGVVLAAGGSSRLGTPKQLLPYGDTSLLGASVDVARTCGFDQLIVTLGGAADAVRQAVPLEGIDVATADDFGTGCSSSLRAALTLVSAEATGIVLMLGDQPGLSPTTVERLVEAGSAPIVICRYDNGIGHPFWLSRGTFGALIQLHGDKAVWKLIESGRFAVHELPVEGSVPPDVDTWDDYRRLLASVSR